MTKDQREKACGHNDERVLEHLAGAWNVFVRLEQSHPDDVSGFRFHLHAIQSLMAMREMRKAHPDQWPTYRDISLRSADRRQDELNTTSDDRSDKQMNDAIRLACERAIINFGGHDNTFTVAGFSHYMKRVSGVNETLDGRMACAILAGRSDVRPLSGGSYYVLLEDCP